MAKFGMLWTDEFRRMLVATIVSRTIPQGVLDSHWCATFGRDMIETAYDLCEQMEAYEKVARRDNRKATTEEPKDEVTE